MNCKNYNIILCPACNDSNHPYRKYGPNEKDICWISLIKSYFKSDDYKAIKDYFVQNHYLKDPYYSMRCSYWVYEMVRIYYPEYLSQLDKVRVLM